jgi:hypothetical protein
MQGLDLIDNLPMTPALLLYENTCIFNTFKNTCIKCMYISINDFFTNWHLLFLITYYYYVFILNFYHKKQSGVPRHLLYSTVRMYARKSLNYKNIS